MSSLGVETIYSGRLFRSRIEARWAVFLTELEFEYEYENAFFVLEDGAKYLPDFYLPQCGVFLEIKRVAFKKRELEKCLLLAKKGHKVIPISGLPSSLEYTMYFYDREPLYINNSFVYDNNGELVESDIKLLSGAFHFQEKLFIEYRLGGFTLEEAFEKSHLDVSKAALKALHYEFIDD